MKILQVITSLQIGGAEKLVTDLSLLYQKAGHDVNVLVFNGTDTILKRKLEKAGIKVFSLGKEQSVYKLSHILKLKSFLPQYDIIHTHNTACQYFVAIAKILSHCKHTGFITTEHSASNRRRNIIGFRYIDRWMYKQYNEIVSISGKATENLQSFIGKRYKIKTIFNGVNLNAFINSTSLTPNEIPNYNPNDYNICMVAGFRIEKDQDTLIRTLVHLPKNYKVWLVGDGIRRQELENLVKEYKLTDRVIFWGIQSNIPSILKASNIVVMSSHWEGLSLSSIEGMASERPFIASDVDGLHEITEGAGILFPHEDDKKLAEEIKKLSEDENYYKTIVNKCLIKAREYDIEKTKTQYLKLYESILQND